MSSSWRPLSWVACGPLDVAALNPRGVPARSRRASTFKNAGVKDVVGTVPQADAQGRESRMRRGTSHRDTGTVSVQAGPGPEDIPRASGRTRTGTVECVCVCVHLSWMVLF